MWKNFGVNSLRNLAILVNITFVRMRGQHGFLCCRVKDKFIVVLYSGVLFV